MKGSDLIALTLKNSGIQNIHTVTGGAIVHVIDSCARLGLNVFITTMSKPSFAAVAESRVLLGLQSVFVPLDLEVQIQLQVF